MAATNTSAPELTGEKQDTRFQKGQSGNPAGRPKGARSKLGEDFIQALAEDFTTNGVEVIEKMRLRDPTAYLKIVSNILPKEAVSAAFNIDVGKVGKDEFTDATSVSVEDILATVAKEAGPEHAKMLANMFGVPFQTEAGVVIDQQPSELARILARENRVDRRAGLSSLYRQRKITLDDLIAAEVDPADIEFVARTPGVRDYGIATNEHLPDLWRKDRSHHAAISMHDRHILTRAMPDADRNRPTCRHEGKV